METFSNRFRGNNFQNFPKFLKYNLVIEMPDHFDQDHAYRGPVYDGRSIAMGVFLLTRCECDLVINTLGAIIFELELQVL